MITWVLILFAHVGPIGDGNSNALASVPGFQRQAECKAAGEAAVTMANGTVKKISYVCVQQTR